MTARSARPRSTLKNTLNPSNTSIRLKSHARVGSSRRPRTPSDGSPSVSTSAAPAPISATVPGSSPARRPADPVVARSTSTTARIAAESASSGRKNARLPVIGIYLFRGPLRRSLATRIPLLRPQTRRTRRSRTRRLGHRDHVRGGGGRRGADLLVQAEERGALQIEDGGRIDAEEDDDRAERSEREELAEGHVGKGEILRIRLTEVHPLERPEEVARRQDDGARRDDGEHRECPPGAEQDEDLGDESGEPGQPHRREESEARHPGVDWEDRGEAAEPVDLAVMRAVVDDTHQEEEHGRDRAVVEHLEHGAVDALRREGGHAEHDVAHVADARVGDELLQIRLCHRHDRAVDDVEGAEGGEAPEGEAVAAPRRRERRGRQDAVVDPQDAVGAHLEEHPREDDRDRGRELDVRVGEPGVEGEGGNLDREADEEGEPEEDLYPERDAIVDQRGELGHVERVRIRGEVEVEDRDQHEDRAEERVEEELDRRILPSRAAPDADQEVHREEHRLPEDEEEEEIERAEDAHHARVEETEERVVALHALLDAERGDHADEAEERGQHDHGETHPVEPDEVVDPERRDPRGPTQGLD